MPKNITPLATLMNLLRLSSASVAENLRINKTTLSKWRSGARKLGSRSPYFEALIEYFLLENNLNKAQPLKTFFKGLFPESDSESDDFISGCLRYYLLEERIPEVAVPHTESLVQAPQNAAVFRGAAGRKNAVSMLLSVAENLNEPGGIKILELDQIDWLCRDMPFLQDFVLRLSLLLKKGFQLEICYSPEKDSPEFRILLQALEPLLYNKNYHVFFINTEHINGIAPSIYAVCGYFTAVGFNCDSSVEDLYTNVFFDHFTNNKYLALYSRIVEKYGKKLAGIDDSPDKDRVLKEIALKTVGGELQYYGTFLSVVTMDESLLAEIMAQNNLDANEKERCLLFYRLMRTEVESAAASETCMYVDIRLIESALAYDSLIEYELSALTDRQVTKTSGQYRSQLRQTVEWIRKFPHIKIALVGGYHYPGTTFCSWINKNKWCLAMNVIHSPEYNQLVFFDEPNMISIFSDMCDKVMINFPLEFSSTDYVSEFFEKMLN